MYQLVKRYLPQLEDMALPTSLQDTLSPQMVRLTRSVPVVGTVFSGVMLTKFMLLSSHSAGQGRVDQCSRKYMFVCLIKIRHSSFHGKRK
jgi:hypothetical protein